MVFLVVYCIVDTILFIVAFFLLMNVYKKNKYYNLCTGTVIGFQRVYSMMTDNSNGILTMVSYDVDGKNYVFNGAFYTPNMKVGTKVKVFYNKEDPTKASMKGGVYLPAIIVGSLAIGFLVGIIFIIILIN